MNLYGSIYEYNMECNQDLPEINFGQPVSDLWKESIKIALEMLRESGVELVYYDDKLFDESFEYRFNGMIVNP